MKVKLIQTEMPEEGSLCIVLGRKYYLQLF